MASSAAEIAAAIEAEARKSPEARAEMRKGVQKEASEGVEFGKGIAPVGDDRDPHPGQFRDSIHAEDAPDKDGLPAAKIVSDDPTASFKEWGTSRTPEHGTFAQIAAHLGATTGPYTSNAR